MTQEELLNEFLSLPAEAQCQVLNFIAFLRHKKSRIITIPKILNSL